MPAPTQANLDVATLQKDIGIAQYEKAIQTAFREVADGLAARGTYGDQSRRSNALPLPSRPARPAQLLFKNGVDSYLAVLTAQTVFTTPSSRWSSRLARLTSLVDLYRSRRRLDSTRAMCRARPKQGRRSCDARCFKRSSRALTCHQRTTRKGDSGGIWWRRLEFPGQR